MFFCGLKAFEGKTFLITGAASGLGYELANVLAKLNTKLVLTDINAKKLEEVAGEMQKKGAQVVYKACDVTRLNEMQGLKELVPREWGMDVVIANAGVGGINPANVFDLEIDRKIMEINYFGVVNTLSLFLNEMMEKKSGQLIGISSLASIRGLPQAASYSSSKAAQNNFLESWRLDLAPYGIKVMCARPGFIKTPMTAHDEFPLPFMVEAQAAATAILRAALCKKKIYSFPWPMAILSVINRWLPVCLYDFLLPRLNPPNKNKKARIF